MRPDNNRHFYPAHRLYVTLDAVINGSRFLQADALPVTKQTNSVKSLKESVKELTPATEQKRLESPFHDPINYRRNVCKAGVCSRSHTKKWGLGIPAVKYPSEHTKYPNRLQRIQRLQGQQDAIHATTIQHAFISTLRATGVYTVSWSYL